jgi:EAL domain-containing protein (putative c-di-GMP-specific phosphodiesterase class I)/GGDEF domain-containing protein
MISIRPLASRQRTGIVDEEILFSDRAASSSHSVKFIAEFLKRESPRKLTGLLLARLDAFNRIGATFGDERSTEFCNEYAQQLRDMLPPKTPVLRLSDRRFAILLSLDSMTTIIDIAARLAEEQPPQFKNGDDLLFVDLTLGVAMHPTHADTAESLYRRAELALNEASAKDLNFEIYRPEATQEQVALWKFSSDLEQAIKLGGIEVYLQPKVRTHDGEMVGAEALIRWRQETGRLILPGEFVPISERSGSIVPLTWLVFDKVAQLVESWPAFESEFKIAINVSARVLDHTDFGPRLDALSQSLAKSNVGLILELTEESLISDYGSALTRLKRIRKSGVELAIDDFGKGYSSLSYLKDIPASEIKIDKTFVTNAPVDEKDRHIIRAAADLAHAFGMRVVGEGVDCLEVMQTLDGLGCELVQGFYIARPMRAELLLEWARAYGSTSKVRALSENQPPRAAEA